VKLLLCSAAAVVALCSGANAQCVTTFDPFQSLAGEMQGQLGTAPPLSTTAEGGGNVVIEGGINITKGPISVLALQGAVMNNAVHISGPDQQPIYAYDPCGDAWRWMLLQRRGKGKD
jgi:hypothetical protein